MRGIRGHGKGTLSLPLNTVDWQTVYPTLPCTFVATITPSTFQCCYKKCVISNLIDTFNKTCTVLNILVLEGLGKGMQKPM